VRAFLDGAGPAAIGPIAGAAVSLTLSESWPLAIRAAAVVVALFGGRRGVVLTLIAAGALAAPLPG
jgi:chromate transporter